MDTTVDDTNVMRKSSKVDKGRQTGHCSFHHLWWGFTFDQLPGNSVPHNSKDELMWLRCRTDELCVASVKQPSPSARTQGQ